MVQQASSALSKKFEEIIMIRDFKLLPVLVLPYYVPHMRVWVTNPSCRGWTVCVSAKKMKFLQGNKTSE